MEENESNIENSKKNTNFKEEPTSLISLIAWNISKALEKNPCIDLKFAIKAAEERMEKDVESMVHQFPEERHLACALLAWQQLGHSDADSLYKYVEDKKIEQECTCKKKTEAKTVTAAVKDTDKDLKPPNMPISKAEVQPDIETYYKGPVVKLPMNTNIVMRLDSTHQNPRTRPKRKDATSKIDAACCMDSECVARLALVDAATSELRDRANKLAKREAERVELLERAEAAWRDLEIGYQRRLSLAEEKEEDMTKEIEKLIEERNGYKNACTGLVQELKEKGEAAENDKDILVEIEKQVYEHACVKLRLTEECARAEAELAEHQCKAGQLDRDLQFKEEQTRRKKSTLESDQESARALTIEAERTMRGELSALREQIKQVSNELLLEDAENGRIKDELEKLRQEKMEMIEDLEGCKETCDSRMQGKLDDLKKKREKLAELKEQVMECQCKLPVDEVVEVKRTPSLAALCRCSPDDKLVESCSCTSLRERLLSNLLADLFAGLQAELGGSGAQMPCQLLKCLEDKHNWDRASVVKSNLRNFFSQLLIGELDIAIATSIEKYHAKWVGASCADDIKGISCRSDDQNDGWEERAIERKAQKLATKLAEQLFQERADELTERAKEIVKAGPPPCECRPPTPTQAVFPCLVKTTMQSGGKGGVPHATNVTNTGSTGLWKRTQQDVTQLRLQIEDLKKDSIKKEDLKLMEQKIAKIVQQASGADNKEPIISTKDNLDHPGENRKKDKNTYDIRLINQNKLVNIKRKLLDSNSPKRRTRSPASQSPLNEQNRRHGKRFGPSYAVNVCLCGPQKEPKAQQNKVQHDPGLNDQTINPTWKQKIKDNVSQISTIKQTKPITTSFPTPKVDMSSSKTTPSPCCPSDCICFHRRPSNTSIDKLLETLTKWKSDLAGTQDKFTMKTISDLNNENFKNQIQDGNSIGDQNISLETSKKSTPLNNSTIGGNKYEHITDSEINRILPLTTESEYMGAINLDKSNEKVCNCLKREKNTNKNKRKSKTMSSNVFKCINSDACNCKKSSLEIEQKLNKPSIGGEKPPQILYLSHDAQSEETITVQEKIDLPDSQNEPRKVLDDNTISKKTDVLSGDCDYYIKFLGVTLTNANSLELSKELTQNENNDRDDPSPSRTNRDKDHAGNQGNYYTKPSNTLSKPDDVFIRHNYHSDNFNKTTRPTNPNFNESYHFTGIISNDEYSENVHNDNNFDLKSIPESCVCCKNSNMDDSKDIEVNVFHLLEDHLKGKLKEFKSFSCKSSCIPSHEEEKIFTDIMQKVKQVISDCANEMKCKCPGEAINNDDSWKRAYGLLQEYLKIKIQRVQCLCVSLSDNKDLALGNILDKVCNLIEHDFERLKDICKCKNNIETRKHVQIENIVKEIEEMPEKDINCPEYQIILNKMNPIIDKLSKYNSTKSMMFTENISSQVPPNLGMETKSCDAMSVRIKAMQTTETDTMFPYGDVNPGKAKKIDCDCYCNTVNQGNGPFLELYGTKDAYVNLCTDLVKKTDNICNVLADMTTPLQMDDLGYVAKNQQKMELNEIKYDTNKTFVENKRNLDLPYIGYTVDCTCDGSLGSCICMKSVVQANNNKIKRIWNTFMAKNANTQDLSYIMNSTQNNLSNKSEVDSSTPLAVAEASTKSICEIEINTPNEEDIVLLDTKDEVNITHNTTNTMEENVSLATEYSNNDWLECPQGLIPTEIKSNKDILKNSIYFPLPPDYDKHFKSDTQMDIMQPTSSHQRCECDVVPICHVKMLVENIENNLMNSKCTCDSMIAKVCPVHSERI